MFHSGSPKKRKNTETATSMDDNEPSCSSKRPRQNIFTSKENDVKRMERVKEIINHEFMHEIKLKETQLEHLDDRLDEAHAVLNRLRYAIVAEYYKKQEQPELMIEATKAMQCDATALKNDSLLQIAMHPSLKKIIGKRPANLEEIMKVCPKRVAAQNAKHGICKKSTAKRNEEKCGQQKAIAEQDLVVENQAKIKQEPTTVNSLNSNSSSSRLKAPNPHALNSFRVGNKTKCLFVVGNTSKYISNADSQVVGNVSLTHKWLVYVQAKDPDLAISKYIKKVRFFLHPSYRPNDIIDLHAPPFQVARRGWGEFPMRIQLYFYDKFHQKPVQLIHRVVLDTTKSGRHTLGAETVMEVWLREESTSFNKYDKQEKGIAYTKNITNSTLPTTTASTSTENVSTPTMSNKPRTISLTSIKEPFDDNFMDFLNKIDETRTSICADIEKIQPTVVVSESLEPQFANVHRSPIIIRNEANSPLKRTPTQLSPYRTRATNASAQSKNLSKRNSAVLPETIKDANKKLQATINPAIVVKTPLEEPKDLKIEKPTANILSTTNAVTSVSITTNSPQITLVNNTKSILVPSPSGKVFSNVSGTVILPVTKHQQTIQQQQNYQSTSNALCSLTTANAVFQKKIVQVIDAHGKIKTVQMLVATPKTTLAANEAPLAKSFKVSTIQGTQSTNALHANISAKPSSTIPVTPKPVVTAKPTPKSITNLCSVVDCSDKTATSTIPHIKTITTNNFNVKSSASSNSTKNVVFQKEGKLYIIDPLQMKLKQQQKNQVSLLKPQIKQQQQQQPQSNIIATIATDHDYVPQPQKSNQTIISIRRNTEATTSSTSLLRASQLQFNMRNARLMNNVFNTQQDLIKLRKIQFEKRFYRIEFSSMRSAIEYLLRRLPLNVFDKDSPAATFSFTCTAPQEFRNLPAFKQRSCEWLRAKFIARLLRNLKSLQQLDANKEDTFWSTREIVTFARYFAYTPPLKSLFTIGTTTDVITTNKATTQSTQMVCSKAHISTFIKNEFQNNQLQVEYDSLSSVTGMQKWLESMQQQLMKHQDILAEEEIIVIDSKSDEEADGVLTMTQRRDNIANKPNSSKDMITKRVYGSPLKFESQNSKISYLPPLARLETASQFVGEICKDFSIRLQPEEIVPGIVHPIAQTLLAHVLKVFVDRILRQAIANQEEQRSTTTVSNNSTSNIVDRCITTQDVRKAIVNSNELDFLTNRHFGVSNNQIKHE